MIFWTYENLFCTYEILIFTYDNQFYINENQFLHQWKSVNNHKKEPSKIYQMNNPLLPEFLFRRFPGDRQWYALFVYWLIVTMFIWIFQRYLLKLKSKFWLDVPFMAGLAVNEYFFFYYYYFFFSISIKNLLGF